MNDVCRFCALATESSYNIFTDISSNVAQPGTILIELIKVFKNVPDIYPKDGLSQSVCFKCKSQLEWSFLFVQQIKNSYSKLTQAKLRTNQSQLENKQEENILSSHHETNSPNLPRLLPKPAFEQSQNASKSKFFEKIRKPTIAQKASRFYACMECPQKYKSFRRLKEHEIVHKSGNICQFCNSLFANEEDVDLHKDQLHKDKKYQCLTCEMKYSNRASYNKHMRAEHKNGISQYFCSLCIQSEKFPNKEELLKHFDKNHSHQYDRHQEEDLDMNEEFLDEFLLNHDAGEENSFQFSECWADLGLHLSDVLRIKLTDATGRTTESAYKCPLCYEDFPNQSKFIVHLGHVHDCKVLICNKCEASFNRLHELSDHKAMHRLKGDAGSTKSSTAFPQCKICDKIFRTTVALNYHIKTHSGLKPHNCPYCAKEFQANANLRQHLRIVHSNVKRHVCSLCDKQFATLDHLKKHVLSLHQNERQHLCNVCGKRFSQLCHLKQHTLIHTTGKSWQCSLCENTFWKKISLERHIAQKHSHALVESQING